MADQDPPLDDLVGTVGRAIGWMHHALGHQVALRQADRAFAAAELERMQAVLQLLEGLRDMRAGAMAALERQPDIHLSMAKRRRA